MANVLFFVDSDFDEKQSDYNLYSTPCYAIENLYVSTQVFLRVLTDELGLCSFTEKELIDTLSESYKQFEYASDEALTELNAWLIVRVRESEENENIKLNLKNIPIGTFLNIAGLTSTKSYRLTDLDSIFSINTPINQDDLASALHVVSKSDKAKFCRGKYRLEYFRIFLRDLNSALKTGDGIFTERTVNSNSNLNLKLQKSNMISELSQHAETPYCLREFLANYKTRIAA